MPAAVRAPYPDATTRRLEAALLDWIATAPAGFVRAAPERYHAYGVDAAAWRQEDERFESLGLELFAYQFERVPVYRAYAEALGRTPARVSRACDVPALPVEALRRTRVAVFPAAHEVLRFHTSGTTGAPGVLGLDSSALYDLALERGFAHHVVPDLERIRMLLLMPPPQEAPHSSLGYMLERVRRRWGTGESASFFRGGRLLWPELRRALEAAAAAGEPTCVLGTAFAFVHFLDACAEAAWSVRLPARSRIFETGGFKGRARELRRTELCAALERCLGVPATHVVSEYGMTELASQYYTLSLRTALLAGGATGNTGEAGRSAGEVEEGTEPERCAADAGAPVWSAPAWLRPRLVAAAAGDCLEVHEAREMALLAHHDLANRATVAHWLTADLGVPRQGSFVLRGRCRHAELRGCGLGFETSGGPRERSARP